MNNDAPQSGSSPQSDDSVAGSTTQRVFREMIDRIRYGEWKIGSEIPSERALVEELGVSRIALREAMSMLRALGVLDTSHGRKTRVRQIDSKLLGRLFPLMLALEGQQTFSQVFEIRLALESQAAFLAAKRRTDDVLAELERHVAEFRRQIDEELSTAVDSDIAFHLCIAEATGNPLFPMLLSALSGAVRFVQLASCQDDPVRRMRALNFHESILAAIRDRDAFGAQREMEAHLRSSADRILRDGTLLSTGKATE